MNFASVENEDVTADDIMRHTQNYCRASDSLRQKISWAQKTNQYFVKVAHSRHFILGVAVFQ